MQYQIAIDPGLELSAEEFVKAWNESNHGEDHTAVIEKGPAESFLSPEMTIVLISAAVSIPSAVLSGFITEYLKRKFLDKTPPKVSVTSINTPDGKPVMIIKRLES